MTACQSAAQFENWQYQKKFLCFVLHIEPFGRHKKCAFSPSWFRTFDSQEKCSQYEIEIQAKQNEIAQVTSKLDAAVTEKSMLTSAQGDTEKKVSEVMEKYEKLNSDYQAVLQEKNDKTKVNEC